MCKNTKKSELIINTIKADSLLEKLKIKSDINELVRTPMRLMKIEKIGASLTSSLYGKIRFDTIDLGRERIFLAIFLKSQFAKLFIQCSPYCISLHEVRCICNRYWQYRIRLLISSIYGTLHMSPQLILLAVIS